MSLASNPEMISNTRALSLTVRVIGPIWSNDEANATNPKRDTRPYVGFNPTIPQYEAGWRTEPPVSLPRVKLTCPAATAVAEPPLDPPGTASKS